MMRLFATILVTALCCYAQDPMDIVRHAYELQQSGDYSEAASAYREFLRLRPNEVGALSNLGVVLSKLGHYDEAIVEYEAARKLAPADPRISLNLALAYEKSGRITDARSELDQLHAASPDEKQVTMLLADCNLRLGENEKVIALLEPLEKQNPADLAIAYMLGTALIRERRIAEGQRLVDIILKNGDTAESRFLLGSQMFSAGDYPAAVKQFASAAELNPNVPELQAYYGQSLLLTGDADGAVVAFRKELANDPNNFAANLGLAQILTQRKRFAEADPYTKKASMLRPDSAEALTTLGEYYLNTAQYSSARKALEAAVKLNPQSRAAHQDLAAVYSRLNLLSSAATERKKAHALGTVLHEPGPEAGDLAPDFTLTGLHSQSTVHLASFRGSKPVVLLFGSYTCPNFRAAAPSLDRLYAAYGQSAAFLLIYIREAHGNTDWQSTRNLRDSVSLNDASTMGEKQDHATLCTRKLSMKFPAVVDGMDGKVEQAYAAWPSRAFIVGKDGRVLYSTRLTELDFHAEEMESALKRALAH